MKRKNCWVLLLLVLTGIVLGGFIGTMAQDVSWLSWLNFGQSFGFDSPLIINFGILVITFGLSIKITWQASLEWHWLSLPIGSFKYICL